MLTIAFATLSLFAAPEPNASGPGAKPDKLAEPKAAKTCYSATPSGSRMPRKVCITTAAKPDQKADKTPADLPKPE